MDLNSFDPEFRDQLVQVKGGVWACVPRALPPPPSWHTAKVIAALANAERAVGRLDYAGRLVQNPHLIIRPLMRAEAVVSSRIEGTIASLPDVLLFEATPQVEPKTPDVREIINYVHALENGLETARQQAITLPLIRQMHSLLMTGVRGSQKRPGEIRKEQNWIGANATTPIEAARYVPPPPERLAELLASYESFLNTPSDIPVLVRLAMQHYQFEAIHPFTDGNGRIGRVLIIMQLCREQALSRPLLYLSPYFESNRDQYNDHMLLVSQRGAWEEWICFFLAGVEKQANVGLGVIEHLAELRRTYWGRIESARNSALLLKAIDILFGEVAITTARLARALNISSARALSLIEKLEEVKIVTAGGGRQRNRVFFGYEILAHLDKIGAAQPPD